MFATTRSFQNTTLLKLNNDLSNHIETASFPVTVPTCHHVPALLSEPLKRGHLGSYAEPLLSKTGDTDNSNFLFGSVSMVTSLHSLDMPNAAWPATVVRDGTAGHCFT